MLKTTEKCSGILKPLDPLTFALLTDALLEPVPLTRLPFWFLECQLTVLLRNRTKGGCCIHGKGHHRGPLYDVAERAPLPIMLMTIIAEYACDHLMNMGHVTTIDVAGPYIDADVLRVYTPSDPYLQHAEHNDMPSRRKIMRLMMHKLPI